MKKCTILAIIVMGFSLMMSGCGYNQMQKEEEEVSASFGNIQAQLQRRADLIPNLVETVKGYAIHEKDTLTNVIEARAKATSVKVDVKDAKSLDAFNASQNSLSNALGKLMMVTENYPQLKADEGFKDLRSQLEGTENRISVARNRYNDSVKKFNSSIRTFPNSMTNSFMLHLTAKPYFEADASAKDAPKVKF